MTPRYKLRTLLILLAVLPPLLAEGWWKYSAWRAERARQEAVEAERARRKTLHDLIELTTWQTQVQVLSEPPATPMQPGEVDVRKLTRPE
jgi:hypothetical protein